MSQDYGRVSLQASHREESSGPGDTENRRDGSSSKHPRKQKNADKGRD